MAVEQQHQPPAATAPGPGPAQVPVAAPAPSTAPASPSVSVQQSVDAPSPVVSDIQQSASPATVARGPTPTTATTVNGLALSVAAAQSHSQPQSPGSGTGSTTPLSHPPTPTLVNGHPPPPPPLPGARPVKGGEIRWREPMTVKYDEIGQAQPGKLQPAPASQQPPLLQPLQPHPPPQLPPHQQQQAQNLQHQHVERQYAQHTQHPQPPPPPQQHQQSQHQHQQHPQQHHHHHQQPQPHHPQQQQHHHQQPRPQQQYHQQQHQPPAALPLPPLHHTHQSAPPTAPPSSARQATISKPVIMDPPASRRVSQAGATPPTGFPSPTLDHAHMNPKFIDDSTRLTFAVSQSLPESVRRVVRDNWEKCLLGSEFHQAFILNASIHHAIPSVTQRAVRDFGGKMVIDAKRDLIGHFKEADLDEVADLILSKASESFLDKCLEKRLLTIEAKPLINALAKAERLGYNPGDAVQENHHEHVIPQEAYPGAGAAVSTFAQARPPPPPPPPAGYLGQQQPPQQAQCNKCLRTFPFFSAFDHHTKNNVCMATPPSNSGFAHMCRECAEGFTKFEDLQAHIDNRICTTLGPQKVTRGPGRPPRAAPVAQGSPVAILPSVAAQTPGTNNGYPTSYTQSPSTQSTPSHAHAIASRPSAVTPVSTGSPNPSDPYAHLTEESLRRMNEELKGAEAKYAPRFAEAEAIQDENKRRVKVEGLRNSFGTKQSMIRKKYGVRLRERRTKAEIQAERERLGIKRAERERARASMGGATPVQHATPPQLKSEVDARPTGANSGWVAANTPRQNSLEEHDAKRRRIDTTGSYQTPYGPVADESTPTRKQPVPVGQLGSGVSESPATAATMDLTASPSSQPAKVSKQVGASQPPATMDREAGVPSPADSGAPSGDSRRSSSDGVASSESVPSARDLAVVNIDSDSSDDEDIPSTLPAHVRQSLTTQPQRVSPAGGS